MEFVFLGVNTFLKYQKSVSSVKVKYRGHSFRNKGRCGSIGVSETHLESMYVITATKTSSPRRFVITITVNVSDATLQKKPAESDFHVYALISRIRVYFFKPFGQIFLLLCKSEKDVEKKKFYLFQFSFFFMPRIPQNLRERAFGMLNAGMTMNAVAMNIGSSTRAIRHLRQRFQPTGRTEDRPRRERPRI